MAMSGEKSRLNLQAAGRSLLIGERIGSVTAFKNWTIGLKGSGLTQLRSARMMISQDMTFNTRSNICATALIKLDNMNIEHLNVPRETRGIQ
jgi:hypothetical protein